MTELETIQRAKMYLDKLSAGIDPLTDRPVGEGDVVRQARISRCLTFVSEVLQRVLENGGITVSYVGKKPPFTITREQLQQVEISREPVGITELCQSITDAAGQPGMTRLAPGIVLEWLESMGMLEKRLNAEGKQSRRPTAAGQRLGILERERTGMKGVYLAVLYTQEAQRFIVEHLDAAFAFRENRQKMGG